MTGSKAKETKKRLEILNKTNDGFKIASEDLKLAVREIIFLESVKADLWILDWETFIRMQQFCRKRTKPQNGS